MNKLGTFLRKVINFDQSRFAPTPIIASRSDHSTESPEVVAMNENHRILVVDDEPIIREGVAMLLTAHGYSVTTAVHGFDALLQIKSVNPELIISDLNMPQMSGFELLSVLRRRFPEILVIAMSGAYESGDHVPGGVIADAFYAKGLQHPQFLLRTIADLLRTKSERVITHHRQSAPVWIPRNGKDSGGVPFVVLTCTECLRSFPLSVLHEDVQEIQETPCLFCRTPVRYIIDFSLSVTAPREAAAEASDTFQPAVPINARGTLENYRELTEPQPALATGTTGRPS
jgi:CheY-like chemotaxis protein